MSTLAVLGQSKKKQIIQLKSELDKCKIDKSYIENGLSYEKGKNVRLSYDKSNLETKISILTSEKDSFEKNIKFIEKKVQSLKDKLGDLEQEIEVKQDSIAKLLGQMDSLVMGEMDTINSSTDFLNNYFLNRQSLDNHKFAFKLVKVMSNARRYYYDNHFQYLSITSANQFYIGHFRPGGRNKLVNKKPISFLNALMPEFGILKNKFLTLRKKNGGVENLLFSLISKNNSYGDHLGIELTPENTKNKAVISWELVRINNEIFLALSANEFQRMVGEVKFNFNDRVRLKNSYNYKSRSYKLLISSNHYFSNEMMFLIRKKNKNLAEDTVVSNPVFLFKLIEQ
ncbi:MAG: hypothetical protein ACON4X_01535 [Polaribacter sp.]